MGESLEQLDWEFEMYGEDPKNPGLPNYPADPQDDWGDNDWECFVDGKPVGIFGREPVELKDGKGRPLHKEDITETKSELLVKELLEQEGYNPFKLTPPFNARAGMPDYLLLKQDGTPTKTYVEVKDEKRKKLRPSQQEVFNELLRSGFSIKIYVVKFEDGCAPKITTCKLRKAASN